MNYTFVNFLYINNIMENPLTKNQIYYQKHKDKMREYYKEWYKENKDRVNQRKSEYY